MGFVEIEGLRIHYAAPRDPSERRGQRVLYVHGTGCNTRVWDEHLATIADAHTPVAIDLPGHGESAGRGCRGVADYAHHVMELANALGWDRFVVAGHSMGGGIALDIALRHGDRLAGLMCIDTGARLRVHPDILRGAAQAAAQGRGVATAATRLAIEAARESGRHRAMHAFPNVENAPSNAICAKLGFTLLGAQEFEFPPGHAMRCNDWRLDLGAPRTPTT